MALKPQDVLVVLKWALHPRERWTFPALSAALGIPIGGVHASVQRALQARLLARTGEEPAVLVVARENLLEFLIHGVKYSFPVERGAVTRGVPTAHAAPVLKRHFAATEGLPPVWPDPKGKLRGETFQPLYKAAVRAAADDDALYAALALIDAIRGGSARERTLATKLLSKQILGTNA